MGNKYFVENSLPELLILTKADLINNLVIVFIIINIFLVIGQATKKINLRIKVTMVHGEKDEAVKVSYSRKVLKLFPNAKKKLNIVKNGDHSLSSKKGLKIILKELKLLI